MVLMMLVLLMRVLVGLVVVIGMVGRRRWSMVQAVRIHSDAVVDVVNHYRWSRLDAICNIRDELIALKIHEIKFFSSRRA
jgi:cytochrome c oxidase subunit IV